MSASTTPNAVGPTGGQTAGNNSSIAVVRQSNDPLGAAMPSKAITVITRSCQQPAFSAASTPRNIR